MPRKPAPSPLLSLLLLGALAGCGGSTHRAPSATRAPAATVAVPARPGRSAVTVDAAVDRVLAYTPYVSAGSRRRKDVALTFDDGPSPFTPRILAILRREHVPATFFQVGRSVRADQGIGRDIVRAGLPIGDHTQTHPLLDKLSEGAQRSEIEGAANAIAGEGAPFPRLFRPPYGSFDAATLRVARSHHMLMVLWTVDTKDFSQPGTQRIAYTALSGARGGAIILMHDGGGPREQTVAALPRIIHGLERRRFHLVTVPQLIADDPPPHGQPAPHNLAGA